MKAWVRVNTCALVFETSNAKCGDHGRLSSESWGGGGAMLSLGRVSWCEAAIDQDRRIGQVVGSGSA